MENLTLIQKEEIKNMISSGVYSEAEIIKIIEAWGYSENSSIKFLNELIIEFKKEIYFKHKESKEDENKGEMAFGLAVLVSGLASMIGKNNVFFLFISLMVAFLSGYIGFPKKPIAGIIGCLTGALIMPFATSYYFEGCQSFFKIELIVPIAISFGPALLLMYLISKFLYQKKD